MRACVREEERGGGGADVGTEVLSGNRASYFSLTDSV